MILPSSENEFLSSVLFSLRKRQKAIKNRVESISCEKIVEIEDGERFEKLEIDAVLSGRQKKFRIYAWDDRWVWIDAREWYQKSWLWEWTGEGRLLGHLSGRELIEALESTESAFFEMDSSRTGNFDKIWEPMLAKGPQPVR